MNHFESRAGRLISRMLLLSLLVPTLALAQQKELSVEELEQYIKDQKAILDEVRLDRDETRKKVEKIRAELEEQDAKKALIEEELKALCKEQEELKPDTYNDCTPSSDD